MDLEKAIARLAEACVDLEAASVQRCTFHSRRAERIRSDNTDLQKANEELSQGLDGAIARLRTVLGG